MVPSCREPGTLLCALAERLKEELERREEEERRQNETLSLLFFSFPEPNFGNEKQHQIRTSAGNGNISYDLSDLRMIVGEINIFGLIQCFVI